LRHYVADGLRDDRLIRGRHLDNIISFLGPDADAASTCGRAEPEPSKRDDSAEWSSTTSSKNQNIETTEGGIKPVRNRVSKKLKRKLLG